MYWVFEFESLWSQLFGRLYGVLQIIGLQKLICQNFTYSEATRAILPNYFLFISLFDCGHQILYFTPLHPKFSGSVLYHLEEDWLEFAQSYHFFVMLFLLKNLN